MIDALNTETDDADDPVRWWKALGLCVLIHLAWMGFLIWYTKLLEGPFLCCDPSSPGGCSGFFPSEPCPAPRPYERFVVWTTIIGGLTAAAILPLWVFRLPVSVPWLVGSVVGMPLFVILMTVLVLLTVLVVW